VVKKVLKPGRRRIFFKSPLLTFRQADDGTLLIEPTPEGVVEAKEMLASREDRRRGILCDEASVFEYAMGNGWARVPPEDIGALTDATIISMDGFLANDGKWYPVPSVLDPAVFAHMDYQVEDPIETWARGETVKYVRALVTIPLRARRKVLELYHESVGK
jgi:hypothetical protein